jgi:molybdenum cofactor cytidylyltransferase
MPDAGVAILVLAAGGSSRMGRSKQLLAFAGKPLVRHAVGTAIAVGEGPVVVVVGSAAGEVDAHLRDLPVVIVQNERWESGIGSSIRAGMSALLTDASQPAAVVILLADQPLVTAGTIRRLIDEQARTGKPVCAAAFDGTIGPPVLVTRPLFPQLLELPDHRGAKHIWVTHPDQVHAVPCPEAATDLDTPADYRYWSGSPASDVSAG